MGVTVCGFSVLPFVVGVQDEAPRTGQHAPTGPWPDHQKATPQAWARRPQAQGAEFEADEDDGDGEGEH